MNNRLAQTVTTCNQFTISKSSLEELAGVCNMSGRRKKSQMIQDVEWQCTYCTFKNSLCRKYCKRCDKRHKMETEQHSPKIVCSPKVQAPLKEVCRMDTKENIRQRQMNEARKYMENINEFCSKYDGKFQDASFLHSAESLYFNVRTGEQDNRVVQWLRPDQFEYRKYDACEKENKWSVFCNPEPTDICQGSLGSCWFASALAILAGQPKLVEEVMVTQEFNPQGAYQVRLCKDGEWIIVIVDDKLPCDENKDVVCSQMNKKQLWVPLIEKAMAKTYGCYEALDSLELRECLAVLTGSPVKKIILKDDNNADEIWTLMCNARHLGYLIGARCGIKTNPENTITEQEFEKVGLSTHHCYSVLDPKVFAGSHRLVSLRNPWGEKSWNGAWSKDSDEWKKVTGHKAAEGVFWMPLEEMIRYFGSITICMYQSDWYEIRKKVELPLNRKGQVDICGIQVIETSEFVIQLFQPSERSSPKNWSPLDLCVVVAAEGPSSSKLRLGEITSCSVWATEDFVSTSVTLKPGNYLIAPVAFDKLKNRSAPVVGRIAIHASKSFEMRTPRSSNITLAQIIIQLALDEGKTLEYAPGARLFYLEEEHGLLVVGENQSERYMRARCNVKKAINYVSSRGSFLTLDVIPPHHRMVLMILSSTDKYHDGWDHNFQALLHSMDDLQDWCFKHPEAQHFPRITNDIQPLHQLYPID